MTYVVCQTSKCQQTYPIEQFNAESKNVFCEKCGGVLIDKDGRANLSQNPTVIPVITFEEIEEGRKRELSKKYKELELLQKDIQELEQEAN